MSKEPTFDVEKFRIFEREGYSRVATGYESATAQVSAQSNTSILDMARVSQGARVLDVACGPGLLVRSALERGAAVVGVDFSLNMVELARARNPDAEFHVGDAEELPTDDAQFDAVVCSLGILHFPNPEAAMREAFRALAPGGAYVITCWMPPDKNPCFGLILGSVQRYGSMELDLPEGPPLFRFGDPTECRAALVDAGFVDVESQECPVVWHSESPESFLRELPESTARLGPILEHQQADDRARVEAAILEGVRSHTTSRGVELPAPILISVGRKSST